jgi:hypothetical protein
MGVRWCIKYGQLVDGDTFELGKREPLKIACCSCGLVHQWKIRTTKTGYKVTVRQDKRATGQTRRRMKLHDVGRVGQPK